MTPETYAYILNRDIKRLQSWPNWYINRGRLPHNWTKKDLRALSWRRVL